MNITTYFQVERTYLPCTGVGKHINNIIQNLSEIKDFELSLLISKEYLISGDKIDSRTPLQNIRLDVYPYKRLLTERLWKFFEQPKMDKFIKNTDCIYCPVAEYIPTLKHIPQIITMHDMHTLEVNLPWSNTPKHILQRLKTNFWVQKAVNKVDHICTVSEYSKQRIIDLLSVNPDKISVIPNGVDDSFFSISKINPNQLKSPLSEPYIVVIGGLRYKKGGDQVIKVAKELKNQKSNLKILVVGNNEPSLVKLTDNLDNMVFFGIASDEQLLEVLRQASSLLFLSYYEGFGIPMLEAMASGIPAVVANKGALPSVGGDAAIYVDPKNTEMITDILINLENNTQLRSNYVQKGLNHASNFRWKNSVNKLVNILNKYS